MNFRISFLMPLHLFLFVQVLFPLEEVGKIVSISGTVTFAIQGKDIFIQPTAGDILYDQSVIKTGDDGRADIIVYEKALQVPPDSLIVVADLLSTSLRNHQVNETIFKQLLLSLETILKNNFAKVEKKGKGRLETKAIVSSPPKKFITEKSLDTDIPEKVKEVIVKRDYAGALHTLTELEKELEADNPSRGNYALKALCYFFLNQYGQAVTFFGKASERMDNEIAYAASDAQNEITILNNLGSTHYEAAIFYVLTAGVSYFFMNQDDKAIPYFKSILKQETACELKNYACYFLCRSLIRAGANKEARKYLEFALKNYQAIPFQTEWLLMLKKLNS